MTGMRYLIGILLCMSQACLPSGGVSGTVDGGADEVGDSGAEGDDLDAGSMDTEADFDGDGISDAIDPCPVDAENDADGDGVCEALDPCPTDRLDDRDGDGSCDSDDPCPMDPADDGDGDGLCADVDPDVCPLGDQDEDSNGWADACEVLLGRWRANWDHVPVGSVTTYLRDADGEAIKIVVGEAAGEISMAATLKPIPNPAIAWIGAGDDGWLSAETEISAQDAVPGVPYSVRVRVWRSGPTATVVWRLYGIAD